MPNKQPSDYQPPVTVRPDNALAEQLAQRSGEKISAGKVAKRDLHRLYRAYRMLLPKFPYEEALVLVDLIHRLQVSDEQVHLLPNFIRASREVADEELDAPFLEKVDRLSPVVCMAILDAVERFDLAQGSVRDRLIAVGLIRKD